jgi:alanine racemase
MNLTWLEISKSALQNNVAEIKKNLSPKTKFMAVVKANAYGHGLLEVVNSVKNKVDYFAVYDLSDAIFLRRKKITKPILVLGRVLPEQINLAIENNIEVTISTFDLLLAAKKIPAGGKLIAHICADTGLGRDGFVQDDLGKVLEFLKNKNLQKKIEIRGIYTHFASADDLNFDSYTKNQVVLLLKWKKSLAEIGLNPLIHASASAASLTEVATDFDIVRIGIGLYGLYPSPIVRLRRRVKNKLLPALSWKVKIAEVKNLPKGSAISYGCTHILKRDSKIAVLPIGYFDGIPRITSNKSFVLVNGKRAPQIGRVTMNLIVIDATDVGVVKVGDVATIIGYDKKESISADDWAEWAQTSNYEIVTRINSDVPRKII